MATTTNYGWTTPDDTALVKDGAAAIRTIGSSVDTTVKALSPGTTAGDLDYYTSSTAKSRIAIGTTGQILTVAGGVPTWSAAPSSGGYTQLATGTLSGATITISSISASYRDLVLVAENVQHSAPELRLRVNGDTTSAYRATSVNSDATTLQNFGVGTAFDVGFASASANQYIRTVFTFPNYASTIGAKSVQWSGAWSGNKAQWAIGITPNLNTTAINSISFMASTGTYTSGTYTLYGVK